MLEQSSDNILMAFLKWVSTTLNPDNNPVGGEL